MAIRRVATSSLFSRLGNPIRSASAAPSIARSFNTNAQMKSFDDDDDREVGVERRADRSSPGRREPGLFSDVLDPFSTRSSLSQVLNMMDQIMDNPFLAAPRSMAGGSRRSWDVKEDNDALFLRMDMPGLGKEDVKVSVEQNTLVIKGHGEKEPEAEESGRRYSSRIELPQNFYKLGEIKAEMKNGVLRVVVPKVKEDEKKDVFQVKIE